MKKTTAAEKPQVMPIALLVLAVAAVAESLLALYQWSELLVVRSGGTAVCALSETVNCAKVWNSGLASRIHDTLGMPVAALGLVWGLTALGMTLFLMKRALAGADVRVPVAAVRLVAAAGVLACVTFAAGSFRAGALCLTCLGTFALVLAFAVVAWRLLPAPVMPQGDELRSAVGWTVAVLLPVYLALMYPGLKTPRALTDRSLAGKLAQTQSAAPDAPAVAQSDVERAVQQFLSRLSWGEQQAVSDSLAAYKRSPRPDVSAFPVRERFGPADAPVKIVEFTDILCGHCRTLVETMKELKRVLPTGQISVEPRHFPLDSECNPGMRHSDGSKVRCLAAKVQICLEGKPDYARIQEEMFAAQEGLTVEKVLQIAATGSMSTQDLAACVDSPETAAKLTQDIQYAMLYRPRGTPIVLVNGREGTPIGSWLYAISMVGGNADSPAFANLPPPREPGTGGGAP
jgi:serine/threonine-protein kinase